MRKFFVVGLGPIVAALTSSPALAADDDGAGVYGRLGLYFAGSHTNVRLDDPTTEAPGTELDFESDLNFDKGSSVIEGDLGIRLSDNWKIEFQYLGLNRSSTSVIDKQIEVDGEIFDINAEIESGFKSHVYHGRAIWRVSDWKNGDLALTFGIHATKFKVSLEGEAEAPGGGTQFVSIAEKQLAPLPTIGARAGFDLAPNLRFFAQGEVFSLKVKKVKGSLIDFEAGLIWQAQKNVGIGVSYRSLDYSLDVKRANFVGSLDYRMSGPMGFLIFEF